MGPAAHLFAASHSAGDQQRPGAREAERAGGEADLTSAPPEGRPALAGPSLWPMMLFSGRRTRTTGRPLQCACALPISVLNTRALVCSTASTAARPPTSVPLASSNKCTQTAAHTPHLVPPAPPKPTGTHVPHATLLNEQPRLAPKNQQSTIGHYQQPAISYRVSRIGFQPAAINKQQATSPNTVSLTHRTGPLAESGT